MLRRVLIDNVKNVPGWRSNRRIVVFAVDDFGNIRVASREARNRMNGDGLRVYSRFDEYDSLETADDLSELFSTLTSVTDKNGRNAVFTAFALPCNIDFDAIERDGYTRYHYEQLPETFAKQVNGKATWALWNEGMQKGILVPQFHGREHLNVRVFEEKLKRGDHEILSALRNRSYASISNSGYSTISYTAAFEFWKKEEIDDFHAIVVDGLNIFEKVFGVRAKNFTPPVGNMHPSLWPTLKSGGILYTDLPLLERQHQGEGRYRWVFNYTGKSRIEQQSILVRNVVFEPTAGAGNGVERTMRQIEAAFRWNKPAIISSHRINFSGGISEKNRATGIAALRTLLKKMVARWPEVEFMSSADLGEVVFKSTNRNV